MDVFIKISQLLLSLSLLIVIHEFGHYIFARLFKTRVEKFYLFFDPWFSLFKIKRGDTQYGIGWIPLGGYVKISGMIDESMDKEQLKKPPQPYEFRSKKTWQRLLIMLGGIMCNVILAFLIYIFVLFAWGEKYLPAKNVTDGIWITDTVMYSMGLQNGDKIISIDKQEPVRFREIKSAIFIGNNVVVEREGKQLKLEMTSDFKKELIEYMTNNEDANLIMPRMPFLIAEIPDSSINKTSGLEVRDQVVAVNGIPVKYYDEVKAMLDTLKNTTLPFTVLREGEEKDIDLEISDDGKIEVSTGFLNDKELEKFGYYQLETKKYNFFQSVPAGIKLTISNIKMFIKQFGIIFDFNTKAYKQVGSFISIAKLFPSKWDWSFFWNITAFLSIMLAVLNLLPIPALDGGHVIFLLFEIITGRKPGEKFLEYAQIAGMIIILFILVFALKNDFVNHIFKK